MPVYTCDDVDSMSPQLVDWLLDHVDAVAEVCEVPRPVCRA